MYKTIEIKQQIKVQICDLCEKEINLVNTCFICKRRGICKDCCQTLFDKQDIECISMPLKICNSCSKNNRQIIETIDNILNGTNIQLKALLKIWRNNETNEGQ